MSRIGLGLAAACLVLVSACGQPSQTISLASPEPSPSQLAPEVPLPVDVSEYLQAPCTMLKPGPVTAELSEGFSEGSKCTWSAKTPQQPELTATIDVTSGGLEGLYGRRYMLPYFEPADVQGYPAVRHDSERAVPDQGKCAVSVGMSRDALLTVTSRIADPKTLNYPVPCGDADLLAGAIVRDMTKG